MGKRYGFEAGKEYGPFDEGQFWFDYDGRRMVRWYCKGGFDENIYAQVYEDGIEIGSELAMFSLTNYGSEFYRAVVNQDGYEFRQISRDLVLKFVRSAGSKVKGES